LRYLILGPLGVRDGDADVELRGGQQRKLLAILLLHSGEAVSSDLLIEELWDGKPPETAAKALQGYVSSLRKQLGPETVETVGPGYRLTAGREDTDAGHFEELLADARPLERGPAVVKLREALALWRGPALADFAYDEFARHEIERLDELRLSAVERRIELELALGHHDDLVPELEALVHAYPLRERLRGFLMIALYRSGRQAEALDAYRDARTALHDELGLEPSEELQTLQREILDHDRSLAAPQRVDFDVPAVAEAGGPAQGRRLRRPLLVAALGLVILGGTAAALVLTLGADKATTIGISPNSVAKLDRAGTVESDQVVGKNPSAIAIGLGGVWVANSASGTVTRLDPATGKAVDAPIGAGGGDLSDIAVGFGSVWVANGNDGTVTEINPGSDQPAGPPIQLGRQTIAPDPVFYIAVDSHYVWATRGDKLLRIDPRTSQFKVWAIVGSPTGLATGDGYVWVTTGYQYLLRIDPRKPHHVESHLLPAPVSGPVYARRSLWLILGSEVVPFNPNTLTAGSPSHVALAPSSIAVGNGAVWAAAYLYNVSTQSYWPARLARVNRNGGETTPLRVSKSLSLAAVAVGGRATWVAVSATG
jgi:DNA-binding SARP family transcriptional activator